jgi:GT2 family glycosyltransferase
VRAASAPILAFVDDDCEPEPRWAECLLDNYTDNIVAVGGALLVKGNAGIVLGYLLRHNPLEPQELALAKSDKLPYRLYLYLQRQWRPHNQSGVRDIFSFASANMSVRRQEFLDAGGFDERFRFGSEDEDLCRRLRQTFPAERLVFVPAARVRHYFNASLGDTLRRRRAYGRGSAQLYRKWPSVRPTFFPGPLLLLIMLALSVLIPLLTVVAIILPCLFYPDGLRTAVVNMQAKSLLDPYLQLAEESSHDVGFIAGLWRFRNLAPEQASDAVLAIKHQTETELVPRS